MRLLIISLLFCLTSSLYAQCRHYPLGRELGVDDGTGVNGPLDGTMSIECLRFIKTEMINGQRIAILIDDRNKLYWVDVGSSIGRPSGLIKAITPETIFYYIPLFANKRFRLD